MKKIKKPTVTGAPAGRGPTPLPGRPMPGRPMPMTQPPPGRPMPDRPMPRVARVPTPQIQQPALPADPYGQRSSGAPQPANPYGQQSSGAPQAMPMAPGMKKGGKVSSASKRADGCAVKGKTRGKIV